MIIESSVLTAPLIEDRKGWVSVSACSIRGVAGSPPGVSSPRPLLGHHKRYSFVGYIVDVIMTLCSRHRQMLLGWPHRAIPRLSEFQRTRTRGSLADATAPTRSEQAHLAANHLPRATDRRRRADSRACCPRTTKATCSRGDCSRKAGQRRCRYPGSCLEAWPRH